MNSITALARRLKKGNMSWPHLIKHKHSISTLHHLPFFLIPCTLPPKLATRHPRGLRTLFTEQQQPGALLSILINHWAAGLLLIMGEGTLRNRRVEWGTWLREGTQRLRQDWVTRNQQTGQDTEGQVEKMLGQNQETAHDTKQQD